MLENSIAVNAESLWLCFLDQEIKLSMISMLKVIHFYGGIFIFTLLSALKFPVCEYFFFIIIFKIHTCSPYIYYNNPRFY